MLFIYPTWHIYEKKQHIHKMYEFMITFGADERSSIQIEWKEKISW